MPAAFIDNPRRTPRAPVRCHARVALRQGEFWASPTTDYGPRGCQIVSPEPLPAGQRMFLELANERILGAVQLTGEVAWCSRAPPWRTGVAFDGGSVSAARDFFDRLAVAYPGLDTYGRAPERIAADALLAPAPPTGPEPLLTDVEARVLRAVGPGREAASLVRDGFRGAAADAAVNAMFALLGRRYVVVGPPDGAAAAGWAVILAQRGGADLARAEVALR